MQMNLPTLPTQGPMRGVPVTLGSDAESTLRSFARASGSSVSPAMSDTAPDKSRIAPVESRRPGLSCPAGPYLRSFIRQFPVSSFQFRVRGSRTTDPGHVAPSSCSLAHDSGEADQHLRPGEFNATLSRPRDRGSRPENRDRLPGRLAARARYRGAHSRPAADSVPAHATPRVAKRALRR